MSRIASEATRLSASQAGTFLSNIQLQLDANTASFGNRATNGTSIASMALAGLVGQSTRLAFLSLGAGRVFSQIGSVGLEAASLAGLGQLQGDTNSFAHAYWHSALNVGVFRAFSPFHASSFALQQGVQATAMVLAHQAAARAGFEEHSQGSLSEQFGQALAENVAYHVGAGVGQFITGGALSFVQRRTEIQAHQQSHANAQEIALELPLVGMSAERVGVRRRIATSLAQRVAPARAAALSIQNPREVLNEMVAFSKELNRVVTVDLPIIETHFARMKLKDLFDTHAKLLPKNTNEYPGFFRRRLNEFGAAIRHFEKLQASEASAQTAVPEITTAAQEPSVEPAAIAIPKLFARFAWTRRIYLAVMEGIAAWSTKQLSETPALPAASALNLTLSPEELQGFRESSAQIYDNLVLLQEAVRVVRRANGKISAVDRPLWEALESTYEGLHDILREDRAAHRQATTMFFQTDSEDFLRQWTEPFVARTTNLRVSRNLQTLLGNVFLVQGERIGGSLWGAIRNTQRAGQSLQAFVTYYDTETAQLVAFVDARSPLSKKTLANLQARGRSLVRVNYIIDNQESGQLIDALIESPVSPECEKIIRGLVGLQIVKDNPLFAYTNLTFTAEGSAQLPAGERIYTLSNLVEFENRGVPYRVAGIIPRQGNAYSVVTLIPEGGTPSDNTQLLVHNLHAQRLPLRGGIIRLRRVEG